MSLVKAVSVFLTLVLIAPCISSQQTSGPLSRVTAAWTFNFAGAPLRISADNDRAYTLENTSQKTVKKYRLGCVQLEGHKRPKIVLEMAPDEDEIGAGKLWGVEAVHQNSARAACEQRKAKVSVIEIWFGDGKVWLAQGQASKD